MYQDLPELITVYELRDYLKCGHNQAYELVRRKDFPSFKIGSKYYVNKSALAEWIERQSKKLTKAR